MNTRQWIGEKQCVLCRQTLGSPVFKRFYCLHCHHAICQQCSQPGLPLNEKSRKGMCRQCAEPLLDKFPTIALEPRAYSEPNCELDCPTDSYQPKARQEGIYALKEAVNAAHTLLSDISAYENAESLQKFQAQRAELKCLKSQEKWYEVQLQRQDVEINSIHKHLSVLTNLNCDLQWKVQSMERKVIRPSQEHSSGCCGVGACVLL